MKKISILCAAILMPFIAHASPPDKATLKKYLDFPKNHLFLECSQNTYEITKEGYLKFCLNRYDKKKRCEISSKTLQKGPLSSNISFSFRVTGDVDREKYDFSIMQIHSTPNKGEKWRCPPFDLNITKNTIRLFNRWDRNKHSITTGYNCTSQHGTIQSRSLLDGEHNGLNDWQHISINTALSHKENGVTTLTFNDDPPKVFRGPNRYNDPKAPFLKLGVYKPTSWARGQKEICVEYKDIDVTLQK